MIILTIIKIILSIIVSILNVILIIFCILGPILIIYRYNSFQLFNYKIKKEDKEINNLLPGITCIRPICGIDPYLKENLISCIIQDYPVLEIIFCVANETDPALNVINEVIDLYKEIKEFKEFSKQYNPNKKYQFNYYKREFKIYSKEKVIGINPKINNIIKGYNESKYDLIWILDSNVSADDNTCYKTMIEFQNNNRIGLIHQVPIGVEPTTLGSFTEMMFLSTAHIRMYSSINQLNVASCLLGKSNFFSKTMIQDVGLEFFSKYISEDQQIGCHIFANHYRHLITTNLVFQPLGSSLTYKTFFQRRARWQSIRKYVVPISTLVEPLTEVLLNIIASFWSHRTLLRKVGIDTSLSFHAYALSMLLLVFISDTIVFTTVQHSFTTSNVYQLYHHHHHTPRTVFSPHFNQLQRLQHLHTDVQFAVQSLIAYLIREAGALLIWVYAMAQETVVWRDKAYRLHRDGTVTVS